MAGVGDWAGGRDHYGAASKATTCDTDIPYELLAGCSISEPAPC